MAISQLDGVAAVAPQLTTSKLVIAGTENETVRVIGTTPAYTGSLTLGNNADMIIEEPAELPATALAFNDEHYSEEKEEAAQGHGHVRRHQRGRVLRGGH